MPSHPTERRDDCQRDGPPSAPQERSHGRRPIGELLFIGGVFPLDEETEILGRSRGPTEAAANALQWTLIRGLDEERRAPVSLLNAVFVGPYPHRYRDAWVSGRHFSHREGASDVGVGFLNVFGVKHLWRAAAVTVHACRWAASRIATPPRSIVVYSLHTPFIAAAAAAKLFDRSLTVCVVIPDLPKHMNLSSVTGAFRALKAIDAWIVARLLRAADCFVVLTRAMVVPLGVAHKPWIVMEGAIDPSDVQPAGEGPGVSSDEKVVLYTGTLHRQYGILDLLHAFSLLRDPTYRLWICGSGDAESEVREMASRDSRVRYLGQLPRAEVIALQRCSTAVVNPRGDSAEFTKYSFPSKVLEYMASGTPTIVRRLSGMPEEYADYVFVVDGASPADLARKIADVCDMAPAARAAYGARAREFVIERKSGRMQARRILELIARAS